MKQNAAPHWQPRCHLTAERNWMNDPNGPVLRDGVYHLFFQSNPEEPFWGPPHWGHASSTDLVHWTRRPDALAPDGTGPDADGCWSGCVADVDGRAAIYYTGVVGYDEERVESVCRAWGSTDLLKWEKDDDNPLVAGPPPSLGSGYHRDPFLWHDGDKWQMLLAGGTPTGEKHGQILRYESDDAAAWTYRGVFFEGPREIDGLDLGEHWECPQLAFFGDRAVLILSCQDPLAERPLLRSVAFTGTITDGGFEGDFQGVLDFGDACYAPALTTGADGRVLLWGWAQERLPRDVQATASKAGALALPRELTYEDGTVATAPVSELAALRAGDARDLASELTFDHPALEIAGTLTEGREWGVASGDSSLTIRSGPVLSVRAVDEFGGARDFALPSRSGELRILIDGSLVELHTAEGSPLTTRVYWSEPELRVTASGARAWSLAEGVVED